MADTDNRPTPMSDADVTPPTGTDFEPAAPLKDTGVAFEPADDADTAPSVGTRQQIKDSAGNVRQQATDKLRLVAENGKAKADGAIDQLVKTLNDAASSIDEKVGAQYGQYAHQAISTVTGYTDQIKDKSVDEIFDEVRALVAKNPAIATGVAAAIGFVVARLAQSGLEGSKPE